MIEEIKDANLSMGEKEQKEEMREDLYASSVYITSGFENLTT